MLSFVVSLMFSIIGSDAQSNTYFTPSPDIISCWLLRYLHVSRQKETKSPSNVTLALTPLNWFSSSPPLQFEFTSISVSVQSFRPSCVQIACWWVCWRSCCVCLRGNESDTKNNVVPQKCRGTAGNIKSMIHIYLFVCLCFFLPKMKGNTPPFLCFVY